MIPPFLLANEVTEALNEFVGTLKNDKSKWSYFIKRIREDLEHDLKQSSTTSKKVAHNKSLYSELNIY